MPKVCQVDGCAKGTHNYARYCPMHGTRIKRHGDPHHRENAKHSERVDPEWGLKRRIREKSVEGLDGCWLFQGALQRGYGRLWFDGQSKPAHRWAYIAWHGSIPEGHDVDHTCHNDAYCRGGDDCPHRRCVNPEHLDAVTPAKNARRALENKTHCVNGHDYERWSFVENSTGRRRCRLCTRETKRRWKARNR